jgi:hypothetical protein
MESSSDEVIAVHQRGWALSGTPPDVTITRPDGTPHTNDQRWRDPQRKRREADRDVVFARLQRERDRLRPTG